MRAWIETEVVHASWRVSAEATGPTGPIMPGFSAPPPGPRMNPTGVSARPDTREAVAKRWPVRGPLLLGMRETHGPAWLAAVLLPDHAFDA